MNRLRGSFLVDKLVQLVKRDFWRKFIALFFALLLYFYVDDNKIKPVTQRPQSDPGDNARELQPQMSRDVPVKVEFSGRLSRDYRRSDSSIPATVRVTGPEQVVQSLKWVLTQPVPLSDEVTEGFEYVAALTAPDGTTVSPASVTCQIEVVKNFEQRSFPALPVQLLMQADGKLFKAELLDGAQVEVVVRGPAGALSALSAAEVRPYLDISHIDKPGVYEISVDCYVKGGGLNVKEIRPALLKIKITE